jgi:hypothetical protein
MSVIKSESVFVEHTPSDQRRYLVNVLKHLRAAHPHIYLPAIGQFTLARAAIEAGYDRQNIHTSDVTLYSSLLGNLFAGRGLLDGLDDYLTLMPLIEANFELDEYSTDVQRCAYLMWLMKVAQVGKVSYMSAQLSDLIQNQKKHEAAIVTQLEAMIAFYGGINYEVRDLRDYATGEYPLRSDSIVVINPAVYSGAYKKLTDFGDVMQFNTGAPVFNFAKEYKPLYEASKEVGVPFIWYRPKSVVGFNKDEVIFAKEYKVNKVDYWLMTQPELLDDFENSRAIRTFGRRAFVPYNAPIFGEEDVITKDSVITFASVKEEVALYYRDLWAHKLGNTKGEQYYLMLVDGKVFATMAVMLGAMFRLQSEYVFENYGFNAPSKLYPRANKLLMLAITSEAFGDVIRTTTAKVNRYWTVKGLRTTCLSKYRKVKLNNNILQVEKRERMENGMYKIMYWADFRKDTFKDVVARFLKEETGE